MCNGHKSIYWQFIILFYHVGFVIGVVLAVTNDMLYLISKINVNGTYDGVYYAQLNVSDNIFWVGGFIATA